MSPKKLFLASQNADIGPQALLCVCRIHLDTRVAIQGAVPCPSLHFLSFKPPDQTREAINLRPFKRATNTMNKQPSTYKRCYELSPSRMDTAFLLDEALRISDASLQIGDNPANDSLKSVVAFSLDDFSWLEQRRISPRSTKQDQSCEKAIIKR